MQSSSAKLEFGMFHGTSMWLNTNHLLVNPNNLVWCHLGIQAYSYLSLEYIIRSYENTKTVLIWGDRIEFEFCIQTAMNEQKYHVILMKVYHILPNSPHKRKESFITLEKSTKNTYY